MRFGKAGDRARSFSKAFVLDHAMGSQRRVRLQGGEITATLGRSSEWHLSWGLHGLGQEIDGLGHCPGACLLCWEIRRGQEQ